MSAAVLIASTTETLLVSSTVGNGSVAPVLVRITSATERMPPNASNATSISRISSFWITSPPPVVVIVWAAVDR